jgi:hypothetical protein
VVNVLVGENHSPDLVNTSASGLQRHLKLVKRRRSVWPGIDQR